MAVYYFLMETVFQGYATINRRRREEYEKFLDATNRKEGLFRDIVMESDYDPFVPNRNSVKCDITNVEVHCAVDDGLDGM